MSTINADDTDAHYVYTPGWNIQTSSNEYLGGSHCTQTDGASVTLRFRGKYIVIHATVPTSTSPTFSDYSLVEMKLDDRAVVSLSARALPGPIWDHPIYESSGLPETDHTLTLTWVDKPNTTKFCLDRVSISSNIGSAYIPELLTPASTLVSEELESRDFVEYSPDMINLTPVHTMERSYPLPVQLVGPEPIVTCSAVGVRNAALMGAAVGGIVVGFLMLLTMSAIKRTTRCSGLCHK